MINNVGNALECADVAMERGTAIEKACINWHQEEKTQVQAYNNSLIIALARGRTSGGKTSDAALMAAWVSGLAQEAPDS
ncbi:hypothetical protein FSPOR_11757 [Fusarium sporotrichioides]|uniref:Uncharacterized protein n=1 Tax=Fusarium sporotrichioides TaxID=5514 RepID=A0A395RGE6_FUSSP|nr:hypothetical protein FSPOR_11757 [Fusarium sporotrichioides]